MFQNNVLKKFRFKFILKDLARVFWITPLILFSGALFPARTRLTCGLSSSVCANGHTVNVPPRTGFDTRELTELEKEFRFNKSLSRARRAEVGGGPCSSARRRWTFAFRRDAWNRKDDGESGCSHPRDTHTLRTPAPLRTWSTPAEHTNASSLRCLLSGCAMILVPPPDAQREERRGNFHFRSAQVFCSRRLAKRVWILKFKPFHRTSANEQTKWY